MHFFLNYIVYVLLFKIFINMFSIWSFLWVLSNDGNVAFICIGIFMSRYIYRVLYIQPVPQRNFAGWHNMTTREIKATVSSNLCIKKTICGWVTPLWPWLRYMQWRYLAQHTEWLSSMRKTITVLIWTFPPSAWESGLSSLVCWISRQDS